MKAEVVYDIDEDTSVTKRVSVEPDHGGQVTLRLFKESLKRIQMDPAGFHFHFETYATGQKMYFEEVNDNAVLPVHKGELKVRISKN